jgi:hypothetical protein
MCEHLPFKDIISRCDVVNYSLFHVVNQDYDHAFHQTHFIVLLNLKDVRFR